ELDGVDEAADTGVDVDRVDRLHLPGEIVPLRQRLEGDGGHLDLGGRGRRGLRLSAGAGLQGGCGDERQGDGGERNTHGRAPAAAPIPSAATYFIPVGI